MSPADNRPSGRRLLRAGRIVGMVSSLSLCTTSAFAADVAPFRMLPEDVRPTAPPTTPSAAAPAAPSSAPSAARSDVPAPFVVTAEDVAAAEEAMGRTLTYRDDQSAGDAAITNNKGDRLEFLDRSTAANATVVNNSGGTTAFQDDASAGSALMTNNAEGLVDFSGRASAAGANVTNNGGGTIAFRDDASAGSAAIANNGTVAFQDSATADQANIVNNEGASVAFGGRSTAGTSQITNNGDVTFADRAEAGRVLITTNEGASVSFKDASSAAEAAITNSGRLSFADRSTAGASSIVNNETGAIDFTGNSTGGTAFIANNGTLSLSGSASADRADIVNNATGAISLSEKATLGSASVNNGGDLEFSGSSSAGSADILTGPGGRTAFLGLASGGTAALRTDRGGIVDFSGVSDGAVEAGSIEGPGTFFLGAAVLTVGSDGTSTTVDGLIRDGGQAGGAGGSLVKTGSGMLTLAGTSSYTGRTEVAQGTLQAGSKSAFAPSSGFVVAGGARLDLAGFDQVVGSLAGAGKVDLATADLTTGGNGRDTVFSGSIEGTGGLVKTGAGTMEMAGDSTYSGETLVRQGRLKVSGSIGSSPVTVGPEGELAGTGTVGSTTVEGRLARVNDGTLKVAGDLTLARSATLAVSLDPAGGQAALVTVSGTASLGGTLLVSALGNFSVQAKTFRLIEADRIVGTFDSAQTEMPFIDIALAYGLDAVDLDVSRNGRAFASAAQTANQRVVAAAVDALGGGDIYEALVASPTDAAARQGFDALSGEVHASLPGALVGDQLALKDMLLARADAAPAHPDGLWTRLYGSFARADGDGNAAAYDWNQSGVLAGFDGNVTDRWLVGAAAGYGRGDFDVDGRASSADVDTVSVAAYAAWRGEPLRVSFGGLYSWHGIDTDRAIAFNDFGERATADYDARSAMLFGEVGYPVALPVGRIEPFANLAYARLDSDSWTEDGGSAALSGDGETYEGVSGTLGARLSVGMPLGENLKARFDGMAGWRVSSFDDPGATVRLPGTSPFWIGGLPIDRNVLVVGAQAWLVAGTASLGFTYDGAVGELADRHIVGAVLNITF